MCAFRSIPIRRTCMVTGTLPPLLSNTHTTLIEHNNPHSWTQKHSQVTRPRCTQTHPDRWHLFFFALLLYPPPELLTLDNGAIGARRSNKVSEKKRRFTWVPCGNEARHSVLPTVVALAIEMGRESDNRSEKERKRKREAHRDELALRLSSLPLLFLLFPRLL